MKTVIVNGGYRTGSTLAFNIVQELLTRNEIPFFSGGHSTADSIVPVKKKWNIAKIHNHIQTERVPDLECIYTYRHPCDVVASWLSYGTSLEKAIKKAKTDMEVHPKILESYCLKIQYDSMYENVEVWIRNIADHLGLRRNAQMVFCIANKLSPFNVKKFTDTLDTVDEKTELRKNHISVNLGKPNSFDLLDIKVKAEIKRKLFFNGTGKYKS